MQAPAYVWHTGIYTGNGILLNCWPYRNSIGSDSGRVMQDGLETFMEAAGYNFVAVVVPPYKALDSLAAQYKNNPVR
jgi:hypothetical protein